MMVGRGRPRARRLAALATALLIPAALLAACSSGPTPQDVARSYLADWAARDWSAMRALVAKPPADFAALNAAALTDLGAKQASYHPGILTVSGSTAREPVTEEFRARRHRHRQHQDHAPPGQQVWHLARDLVTSDDRTAARAIRATTSRWR